MPLGTEEVTLWITSALCKLLAPLKNLEELCQITTHMTLQASGELLLDY